MKHAVVPVQPFAKRLDKFFHEGLLRAAPALLRWGDEGYSRAWRRAAAEAELAAPPIASGSASQSTARRQ